MIKQFFKDSLIYTIPSLFSKGISLFLLPIYTRILNPADYGSLDLFSVFAGVVNITIALEISQAVARFYPEESIEKKKLLTSTAFWFTLLSYSVFSLFFFMNYVELSDIVFKQKNFEASFRVGILFIFFNGIFYFTQNQLRWELRSKAYALVSIVMSAVTALTTFYLGYFLKLGLWGFITSLFIGNLMGALLGIYYLRNSLSFKLDFSLLKVMLRYSSPLLLSSIAIWVSLYFDRVLISQLLSVQEVGIYGIGYRLASLSSLIMIGFQTSLSPIIYSNLNRNETPKNIDKIFRYFLTIVFSFFLFLSFSVTEILEIVAPETYKNAAGLIFFLVPSIFISGMYVFVPGINIGKKTTYYIWINIMGAVVNLLLNLYLIPIFGIYGSALATMFSSFLVFCIQYNISQKYYYVPFRLAPIFINMILVFAFSYCVLILKNPIISSLPMRIILFILFILSIIYSRLIDNEDFLYLKERIKKLYK